MSLCCVDDFFTSLLWQSIWHHNNKIYMDMFGPLEPTAQWEQRCQDYTTHTTIQLECYRDTWQRHYQVLSIIRLDILNGPTTQNIRDCFFPLIFFQWLKSVIAMENIYSCIHLYFLFQFYANRCLWKICIRALMVHFPITCKSDFYDQLHHQKHILNLEFQVWTIRRSLTTPNSEHGCPASWHWAKAFTPLISHLVVFVSVKSHSDSIVQPQPSTCYYFALTWKVLCNVLLLGEIG